ncbi:CAP domain-containing protein [Kitasatospora sp. NPDC127059]|uniref:CAP domain-containing protein n=1 Tax=unclassified Kitasatospora TaxID=2633591 RepID=UPI00366375B0
MTTLVRNGRILTPAATPWTATGGDFRTEMLTSANFRRVHAGARLLNLDERLNTAAQRHADDLAAHDLLQHDGTDGSTPWRRIRTAGFAFRFAAEIAAAADSVPEAMQRWMHSPQHRDTLLDPRFNHLGIGRAPRRGDTRGRYVLTLGQV